MPASPQVAVGAAAWHRTLRYLWRLPLLFVHATVGLTLIMLMINPLTRRLRWRGELLSETPIRLWSLGTMRIFGMRVRGYGTRVPGAVLLVANHVSWIDIILILSQRVVGFVAKAEIASWPVVGWLSGRAGTIFHHRGNNESLHGVMHQMLLRLQGSSGVGVFPEGRTNNGEAIGAFHARIFQPAVLAEAPAQPVALKYGVGGCAQSIVAFRPRENFAQNMWRLLGEPSRLVEVHFLAPVPAGADGRRRMAEVCRDRIIAAMS